MNDTPTPDDVKPVGAAAGSVPPRTMQRLRYLLDVTKVDDLLDEFERMGMPMGSDRWAEYCLLRLRELKEKERTLNKLKAHLDEMNVELKRCGSDLWRERLRQLTADHQKRSRDREDAAMKKMQNTPTEQ